MCLLLPALHALEPRIWTAVSGHQTQATLVSLEAGMATLRLADGREVQLALQQLAVEDRIIAQRQAEELAARIGLMPEGEVTRPTGRREVTWRELEGDPWPDFMHPRRRQAAEALRRPWRHAESRYFVIHFQQLGFARQVARVADFLYEYIASDLPGYQDRYREKSHIVVFRNMDEWRQFLQLSEHPNTWSAAFVTGRMMYLPDLGDFERNANLLAHEMSHLVLNRFFRVFPPLWLNEGLAEWYGNIGYRAFKGQRVDPRGSLGRLRDPIDLATLLAARNYPANIEEVRRFYNTSQHLVAMLILRRGQEAFVEFLQSITVEGKPAAEALATVYGFQTVEELQQAFNQFIR